MINALKFTTNSKTIISMKGKASSIGISLEYSYDGIDWKEWDLSDLSINKSDTLYIRGNNPNGFNRGRAVDKYCSFVMEGGKVRCSGNIMSLIDYKNLPDVIPCEYCFYGLFKDCTALTTAPELPATKLADGCYRFMFSGCTALTTAPELPATKLTHSCYCRMFEYCTSLKTAPELPATILADWCYSSMFRGCTSLTAKPELPATKLAKNCYADMIRGCTSIKTNQKSPTISLKEYCQSHLSSMLND